MPYCCTSRRVSTSLRFGPCNNKARSWTGSRLSSWRSLIPLVPFSRRPLGLRAHVVRLRVDLVALTATRAANLGAARSLLQGGRYMPMIYDLNEKTAVVNGGAKGLGKAIVECLSGSGCASGTAAAHRSFAPR